MKISRTKALPCVVFVGILSLLMLYPVCTVFSQTSGTTVAVKPSTNSPRSGETLTINITIVNVQNLYAVDVDLHWNTSALKLVSAENRLGVESYPGGVLHNTIQLALNEASQDTGEYHLAATSVAPAAAFSGSGTIATLKFNVTSPGHSDLILESQLADYPPAGGTSNFIDHTDSNGTVDSVVPEFPSIAVIGVFLILLTLAAVVSQRVMKKNVFKASLTRKL